MTDVHPVVKLLLARMESHPEEFKRSLDSRWYDTINEITSWGNEADKTAVNEKLRDIRLQEAHEDMMDELCNGDERRRKEEEEREYEQQLIQQMRKQQYQQMAQQQGLTTAQEQYANSVGSFGKPLTAGRHPTMADMENNGVMNALRNMK